MAVALVAALPAFAGETRYLDRVVAVVEGGPITDSEVRAQARLVAFVEGHELDLSARGLAEALDRLIHQRLAEQEMAIAEFDQVGDDAVEQQMGRLKRLTFGDGLSYGPALRRYGVKESEVREFVTRFLTLERFLAFRFRTGLEPSDEALRKRYDRDYGDMDPRVRKPLAEVETGLRNTLIAEEADRAIDHWIRELNARSRIEYLHDYLAAETTGAGAKQP